MRLRWAQDITALLLFNASVAAWGLPSRGSAKVSGKGQSVRGLPLFPSLTRGQTENHLSSEQTVSLGERSDDANDLVVQQINIRTSTIPVVHAAHFLEHFYNSILYNALAPWSTMEPQLRLRMTMGSLELTMMVAFNAGGTPRGIPWSFVRDFARNMLVMTRMGFTGTYEYVIFSKPFDPCS